MAALHRNVIVSVLFTVFGGPGIVLVWVPLWVTRFRVPASEPRWQTILAALLILAGVSPGLESVKRLVVVGRGTLVPTAPTEHLVVSGFYRYVRNPMYVGAVTALSGEVLLFRSRSLAVFVALLWLGLHLFVRCYEEPMLARRHSDEYRRFKRNVPRWLPRLKPWRNGDP